MLSVIKFFGRLLFGKNYILAAIYVHAIYCLMEQMVLRITGYFKASADVPLPYPRVALMTGGCSGIGYQLLQRMLKDGWTVILGTRSVNHSSITSLQQKFGKDRFKPYYLNLAQFQTVRAFLKYVRSLDLNIELIVNNAGVMCDDSQKTDHYFNAHYQVNFLSHLLINLTLLRKLSTGRNKYTLRDTPHIINVASSVHSLADVDNTVDRMMTMYHEEGWYIPEDAYCKSKLAVIMGSIALQDIIDRCGLSIRVSALHPGVCDTPLFQNVFWYNLPPFIKKNLLMDASEGADCIYRLINREYEDCKFVYHHLKDPAELPDEYSHYSAELMEYSLEKLREQLELLEVKVEGTSELMPSYLDKFEL